MADKIESIGVSSFLDNASATLFSRPFLYSILKSYPNNLVGHYNTHNPGGYGVTFMRKTSENRQNLGGRN